MGTMFSMEFVADLFYLDLIGRYRCRAAVELPVASDRVGSKVILRHLFIQA
jgi:hypothetical protein